MVGMEQEKKETDEHLKLLDERFMELVEKIKNL